MTLPRRIVIGLWIVLPILIVIGVARLRFDVEVLDLLPTEVPAVDGLKLYQQHFANANELIITVQATEAEQAESMARAIGEKLRGETNLVTSVTFQPPWLEHPGQAGELIGYLWFNQPPDTFNQLSNRFAPDKMPASLTEARDELATSMSPDVIGRLSYDPLRLTQLPESVSGAAPNFGEGQNLFSSADGKFHIIFVEAKSNLATYRECFHWLQIIKGDVQSALANNPSGQSSAPVIGYTGRPAFVSEIARGMEHDITISVGGTSVIIAILFWLAHRRVKPMLWLLTLLALVLAGTLALGGLIYGAINVVSMGFAAILLGLAVDYAVVHYQEALAHPDLSVPEIRRAIAPSIFWAAVTTISAFLVLNFGGLPGLGQLGTLVGVGVALAAFVMIFAFLPPLFPERRVDRSSTRSPALPQKLAQKEAGVHETNLPARRFKIVFAATGTLILLSVVVLLFGLPKMDSTANALRPRNSPAYAALDSIKEQLGQKREPLWLLISGANESAVAQQLQAVQPVLNEAVSNHVLSGFTLPAALWPRPEFQAQNRVTAKRFSGERDNIRSALLTNGFTETSFALTSGILDTWRWASEAPGVFWPTNDLNRWIFGKLTARTPTNFFAVGLLYPDADSSVSRVAGLQQQFDTIPSSSIRLSGWELLGHAILGRVMSNLWKLVVPMLGLVFLSLWLAFRRPIEILLSLAILILSGLFLLAVMRLVGWSWNLLSLMGLPLILGTGVDYSIFMQLALRRYHGDVRLAHRSVGRALLLCGGTAVAGFGAITLSSNAGMASLGQVCAVGIASNVAISVLFLPTWWTFFTRRMKIKPNHE